MNTRIRISRDLEVGKYLMLGIGIVIAIALVTSIGEPNVLPACSIVLVVCGILFYQFHHAKTVEFDDEYMYVTGRGIDKKVPLKNVYQIKLTMTKINREPMWKIGYVNEREEEEAVRILPKRKGEFEAFKRKVKEKNADVQMKNRSHSFDFDQ